MPPPFGYPHDFEEAGEDEQKAEDTYFGLSDMAMWYTAVLAAMLLLWLMMFFCLRIISLRQKTRSTQQRRQYIGTRARPSLPQTDPTIYVSPANLPPPPKYEAMAPPSYEEVVGIHYPNFQPPQVQPITQPLAAAMAQNTTATASATPATAPATDTPTPEAGSGSSPTAVLTIANERSVTAVSS